MLKKSKNYSSIYVPDVLNLKIDKLASSLKKKKTEIIAIAIANMESEIFENAQKSKLLKDYLADHSKEISNMREAIIKIKDIVECLTQTIQKLVK